MPTWKMYTRREDPLSHLKYFEIQMDLQGVRGVVCCRIFPATLSKAAQQCYFKLTPGKFNSWKAFSSKFHAQFSSSRQLLLHLGDLVEVKQRPGEPLRAYISKFMKEATMISRVTEHGKLSAILGGIEVLGELWKDIRKNGLVDSMSDFLDRPEGFIKLEEAIQRAEGEPKPRKAKAPSTGMSTQLPHYPSNSSSNGKRSNNNNRQGNGKKGKFAGKIEQAPRENQAEYTAFTILTEDIESVYMGTQSLAPYKKPAPMRKDVTKRNMAKKNNRHVQKYVKADQNQRVDNNQDLLPPPVYGHLEVIIGGSPIAGDSGKARERFPHNDPLVVKVQIANKMVARTMIDNGASFNILFKTTYEKMGLQLKDLTPCLLAIYSFSGQGVAPLGRIRLPLTVGQAPTSMTVMAQFLVLDVPSAFNVMLGRLALYDLKVVTSIFHSCLKFPTKNGVGCLRGNQQTARE
ncbi:hypothetical protein CsatB_001110 [Cannabis sativa]|uniref:uncharacterized protein LOC115696610 n=1 Tax=Cannabis sativa TaxID=3483 RepID=UPI0029CA74AF|nr:uncharacterized protein LOC115696610 [Cannabis sativa]